MIMTEKEYKKCSRKLDRDLEVIEKQRAMLKKQGFSAKECEVALQPAYSFYKQLEDEVVWYERVMRREFGVTDNLTDMGRTLIGLRIANGLTQRELAEKLGVDESQVSRDERNEYHNITLDRAQKVIEAMGEKVIVQLADKLPRRRAASG